jgi:YHS domain-containing protein
VRKLKSGLIVFNSSLSATRLWPILTGSIFAANEIMNGWSRLFSVHFDLCSDFSYFKITIMKNLKFFLPLLMFISFSSYAQKSAVFIHSDAAIGGYDPVAYFTEGKPVKGDKNFSYSWQDADWYFSSAQNLESFKASPEKYAPQYGGYCAFGMANGYKAKTEPDAWSIVDDKLYLNYNTEVRNMWKQKQKEHIGTADKNWPKVRDKE